MKIIKFSTWSGVSYLTTTHFYASSMDKAIELFEKLYNKNKTLMEKAEAILLKNNLTIEDYWKANKDAISRIDRSIIVEYDTQLETINSLFSYKEISLDDFIKTHLDNIEFINIDKLERTIQQDGD